MFESGEASELTTIGVIALRTISLNFVPAAIGITLSTVFQAVGKGTYSLIMSVSRQLVVLLPVAWILSRLGGLNAIWYAWPIAEVTALVLCLFMFARCNRKMIRPLGDN
jgi:Na+-driven multidrug efflux pump